MYIHRQTDMIMCWKYIFNMIDVLQRLYLSAKNVISVKKLTGQMKSLSFLTSISFQYRIGTICCQLQRPKTKKKNKIYIYILMPRLT